MDLKDLPVEQLLDQLSVADLRAPCAVDLWIKAESYHPGQTRVQSQDLYQQFKAWVAQQPDNTSMKVPDFWRWGVQMGQRFKKGRSKHGNFYYISRESDITKALSKK
jgi:hypothetical protein